MPQNTRRYFEEAEDLLQGRSPESYGSQLAPLMREKIGDRFQHLVTPENLGLMALIGNPRRRYSYAGVNFPTGLDSPRNTKQMEEFVSPALRSAGQKMPEGKRIFGIGSNANAATYAHELRHEYMRDEIPNRMLDLVHSSTSLPAYKANIQQIYRYITDFNPELDEKTSLKDKEKEVIDKLRGFIGDEVGASDIPQMSRLKSIFSSGNYIDKNIELNQAGAKGAFINGEQLPKHIIDYRAKLPFLNFVGRLDEYERPVGTESENPQDLQDLIKRLQSVVDKTAPKNKKASGGSVENTTHYRKMI